eukprot:gene7964-7380_t
MTNRGAGRIPALPLPPSGVWWFVALTSGGGRSTLHIRHPGGGGGDACFDGHIDEWATWGQGLTSAQVDALYNGGHPTSLAGDGLRHWWRFEEGSVPAGEGTHVVDEALRAPGDRA